MVLELGGRVEGDPQKAGVLAGALLIATLDDIRGDWLGGSYHLTAKRRVLRSSDLAGNAVNIHGHHVCLMPDLELLEVSHAVRLQRGQSQTSPFPRAEVPKSTPTSVAKGTLAPRIYASVISHLRRSKLQFPNLGALFSPPSPAKFKGYSDLRTSDGRRQMRRREIKTKWHSRRHLP